MAYSRRIEALLAPVANESTISLVMKEIFRTTVVPAFDPESDYERSKEAVVCFGGFCEFVGDILRSRMSEMVADARLRHERDEGDAESFDVRQALITVIKRDEDRYTMRHITAEVERIGLDAARINEMRHLCSDWRSGAARKQEDLPSAKKKTKVGECSPSNAEQNHDAARIASGSTSADCSPNSA